jgi:hypothetical protein
MCTISSLRVYYVIIVCVPCHNYVCALSILCVPCHHVCTRSSLYVYMSSSCVYHIIMCVLCHHCVCTLSSFCVFHVIIMCVLTGRCTGQIAVSRLRSRAPIWTGRIGAFWFATTSSGPQGWPWTTPTIVCTGPTPRCIASRRWTSTARTDKSSTPLKVGRHIRQGPTSRLRL